METVAWIFRQMISCIDPYFISIFNFLKLFKHYFKSFYSRKVHSSIEDFFSLKQKLFVSLTQKPLWIYSSKHVECLSWEASTSLTIQQLNVFIASSELSAVEAMTKINRRRISIRNFESWRTQLSSRLCS